MKKTIRLCLCLYLVAVVIPGYAVTACPPAAGQPAPEMLQAAMANARDHGYLWRISKDKRTSYLYGTIHVAKLDWVFPGPNVMQAIRASDTMALELDMLDADVRGRMLKKMGTLRNTALPEPLAKRVRQQAEAMCTPYDSIANLSPELQVTTLSVMVGRGEGLDASYGIDSVLAGIGHGAQMQVVSLETPEAQLDMLQMQNPQETIAFVQDNLDELETGRARTMLKRIADDWARADYEEMVHFDEWCECRKTENEREVMRRLLEGRNPAMADRIDALHKSGKQVFVGVGSLHMFGATGLPALMAKRGYRVERVDFKPQ